MTFVQKISPLEIVLFFFFFFSFWWIPCFLFVQACFSPTETALCIRTESRDKGDGGWRRGWTSVVYSKGQRRRRGGIEDLGSPPPSSTWRSWSWTATEPTRWWRHWAERSRCGWTPGWSSNPWGRETRKMREHAWEYVSVGDKLNVRVCTCTCGTCACVAQPCSQVTPTWRTVTPVNPSL